MSPHLDEDLCLDLLLRLLPEGEENGLFRHIESCHACETLFRDRSAEMERSHSKYGEMFLRRERVGSRAGEKGWFPWRIAGDLLAWRTAGFAAAAVSLGLVLVFVLVRPHPHPRTDDLEAFRLPKAPDLIAHRGPGDAVPSNRVAEGLTAYDRGRVADAIRLLDAPVSDRSLDCIRRIYLAGALVQSGSYERAVDVLRSVPLSLVPEPWASESQWILMTALRRSGQTGAADSLLHTLAGHPNEVGERARRLESSRGVKR